MKLSKIISHTSIIAVLSIGIASTAQADTATVWNSTNAASIDALTFNKSTGSAIYADSISGTLTQVSSNGAMVTLAQVGKAGNMASNAYAIGGIATDSQGNIYYTDTQTHTVSKITVSVGNPNVTSVIAGTGVAGYTGDGASASQATFSNPAGIAIDANDDIYIADSGNNVIRKIDSLSGFVTTVAGTGVAGYTGDGGNALQATLNAPYGMVSNSTGHIIFTEVGNHVVRELAFGNINTLSGTGQAGFYGDGGLKSFAQYNTPMAIAIDSRGNIYIADTGNNRVRVISNSTIKTIAGNGSNSSMQAGSSMTASNAAIASPTGLGIDANDNIYIADSLAKTIVVVSVDSLPNSTTTGQQGSCLASGNTGQSGFLMMILFMLAIKYNQRKQGAGK